MKNNVWKIDYCVKEPSAELLSAYTPLLAQILTLRGCSQVSEAENFINCSRESLLDPMDLAGMKDAVARIKTAIESRESVAVFGDYDVDGITATCLLYNYLSIEKKLNCRYYIPKRSDEGYGLNNIALDALKAEGVSLVITVDCGITAIDEVEYAKTLGIDMIITDHHECLAEKIPDAVAVVDPKQPNDVYAFKSLAGVGVALKLVCACEGNQTDTFDKYVDLAAIGTVADVMPLIEENRYIVSKGIEQIRTNPRPGIGALWAAANLKSKKSKPSKDSYSDISKLSASSIGFCLAPRLNAAGRLDEVDAAVELLLSQTYEQAEEIAFVLCEMNAERQALEASIIKEAEKQLWEVQRRLADALRREGIGPEAHAVYESDTAPMQAKKTLPRLPIVLYNENWHQGVIGITASRLAEKHKLPTIMICGKDGAGKGSCRSCGSYNLFEALNECSDFLLGFGGHALAAGLTIKDEEDIDSFRIALAKHYINNQPLGDYDIECDLLISSPQMLSKESVRSLDLLEPFGQNNKKPLMCVTDVTIDRILPVGKDKKHIKFEITFMGERYSCIFFSHSAEELGVKNGDKIDLAFTPQINEFPAGRFTVQLMVNAVRAHESIELCRHILNDNPEAYSACSRYIPTRAELRAAWKQISKPGQELGSDTGEIIKICPKVLSEEVFCICLMIFLQSGLLCSNSGKIFGAGHAKRDAGAGKVNLDKTALMCELGKRRSVYAGGKGQ